MQQILAAHDIPNLDLEIDTDIYSAQGNQCALQVRSQDRTD